MLSPPLPLPLLLFSLQNYKQQGVDDWNDLSDRCTFHLFGYFLKPILDQHSIY